MISFLSFFRGLIVKIEEEKSGKEEEEQVKMIIGMFDKNADDDNDDRIYPLKEDRMRRKSNSNVQY
jgi:hypothetical protein